jgi:HK97 family phage major capsid protein
VPAIEATANAAGFVAEGAPIPVRDLATKSSALTPRKIAVITALSREMIESSNAEALVTNALIRSVGLALDGALLDSAPAMRSGRLACAARSLRSRRRLPPTPEDAMIDDLTNCILREQALDQYPRAIRVSGVVTRAVHRPCGARAARIFQAE